MANPYQIFHDQIDRRLESLGKSLEELKMTMRLIWTEPLEFKDREIEASDLDTDPQTTTSISLVNCESVDWHEIGSLLS